MGFEFLDELLREIMEKYILERKSGVPIFILYNPETEEYDYVRSTRPYNVKEPWIIIYALSENDIIDIADSISICEENIDLNSCIESEIEFLENKILRKFQFKKY